MPAVWPDILGAAVVLVYAGERIDGTSVARADLASAGRRNDAEPAVAMSKSRFSLEYTTS
jgi:hypothetical protein